MKKIRIIFIIALTVLVLAACGKADKPVEETFTPIDIEEKVPEVDPNTILGTWTYVPEDKNIFGLGGRLLVFGQSVVT